MLISIVTAPMKLPIPAHTAAGVSALAGFVLVKAKLDASYVASNHPVDYFTGQTSFSGEKIKSYYAHMIEAGSLDIYWQTQFIDFGFIAAMFCIGLFVCTLLARLGRAGSFACKVGTLAGASFMLGAISDAIENLWSFVMLSNPTAFDNWLALPYSAFAALKFAFISLGMLGAIICVLAALIGRVSKNTKIG